MPTKEFDVPLDDAGLEWIRYRFTTEGGQVTAFLAQYEIVIGDERLPVVRYDGVHGFAHRDMLNRRGDVIDKQELPGSPSYGEALNIGASDIQENWQRYREQFLRDEP